MNERKKAPVIPWLKWALQNPGQKNSLRTHIQLRNWSYLLFRSVSSSWSSQWLGTSYATIYGHKLGLPAFHSFTDPKALQVRVLRNFTQVHIWLARSPRSKTAGLAHSSRQVPNIIFSWQSNLWHGCHFPQQNAAPHRLCEPHINPCGAITTAGGKSSSARDWEKMTATWCRARAPGPGPPALSLYPMIALACRIAGTGAPLKESAFLFYV